MNIMKSVVYGTIAGLALGGVWQLQNIHFVGGSLIGVGAVVGALTIFIDSQTRKGN